MAEVNLDRAITEVRRIMDEAFEDGTFKELTKKVVRKKVEENLGWEENVLNAPEYKGPLQKEIQDMTDKLLKKEQESSPARPTKRRKTSADVKPSTPIKNEKETKKRKPKNDKPAKKPTSSTKSKKTVQHKSEEIINDNSEEEVVETPVTKPRSRKSATKKSKPADADHDATDASEQLPSDHESPPEKRKLTKSEELKPLSKVMEPEPKSKPGSKAAESAKPDEVTLVNTSAVAKDEGAGDRSESELSVLIDEEPKKRQKSSEKASGKKAKGESASKPKAKKAAKEVLSPDEEQIKKLKSFVVACGVRKVWSKELKDCDTPKSQVSHLRRMLTDLGMTGRFSMEQAKNIREKREFAKEMEDIRDFAEKFAGDRPKRSAKSSEKTADEEEEESVLGEDNEDSKDNKSASRRPRNARQSIMAFLDDQSDSE